MAKKWAVLQEGEEKIRTTEGLGVLETSDKTRDCHNFDAPKMRAVSRPFHPSSVCILHTYFILLQCFSL